MPLTQISLLLSDNGRARAYVSCLLQASLVPASAIIVEYPNLIAAPAQFHDTDLFNNHQPVQQQLIDAGIDIEVVQAQGINDPQVIHAIGRVIQEVVIFAASAGSLLRKPFFELGKTFIHVHPGRLPDYRGSTPMYYSLLRENHLTMTAFIMAEQLDAGAILMERRFPAPTKRTDIDVVYDPYLRACVMVEVMQYWATHQRLPEARKPQGDGQTYYVIHPVLKHIALLAQ